MQVFSNIEDCIKLPLFIKIQFWNKTEVVGFVFLSNFSCVTRKPKFVPCFIYSCKAEKDKFLLFFFIFFFLLVFCFWGFFLIFSLGFWVFFSLGMLQFFGFKLQYLFENQIVLSFSVINYSSLLLIYYRLSSELLCTRCS